MKDNFIIKQMLRIFNSFHIGITRSLIFKGWFQAFKGEEVDLD